MRLMLNNKPLFQIGPLDQGWWPDGLLTPPTDEAMKYDIEVLKKLGFNMLRKHIKVEPARWYYYCDKLGLLVWQDMPSGGMPSAGNSFRPTRRRTRRSPTTRRSSSARELKAMIDHLRFFPCIVVWVPFNEGWGQHDTNDILKWVKKYDPTRLVERPERLDRSRLRRHEGHAQLPRPRHVPGDARSRQRARRVRRPRPAAQGPPLEGHRQLGLPHVQDRPRTCATNYRLLMRRLHPLIGKGCRPRSTRRPPTWRSRSTA